MVTPVGIEPTITHYQGSILALHQSLEKQTSFTQGNNRARVRVVAYHPPRYLRQHLFDLDILLSYALVGTSSVVGN